MKDLLLKTISEKVGTDNDITMMYYNDVHFNHFVSWLDDKESTDEQCVEVLLELLLQRYKIYDKYLTEQLMTNSCNKGN